MNRSMYDAIDALRLPIGGDLYAGYVDGKWPSANAISTRFPHATVVRIATSPHTNDGVVLDCEPGNCTPEQAVNWVLMRRAAGVDPTVYCNQRDPITGWPAARAAFDTHDVPQPHYWVADYDGDPTIPAGAVAKQFASNPGYDASSVADYWPGVDPAPKPAAAAARALEESSMQIEPTSVHPGEYALIVPSGVGELVLAADGYSAAGASLRVVLWDPKGSPAVFNNVSVGGTSTHHVVGMKLGGAVAVTVRRLDAEAYPVAVGFRA